ncbi:MAG: hypothetical protein HY821_19175 [Acidobacteria bacterium]|nr:hypothetical protein [Acidobacteriota bacterium]
MTDSTFSKWRAAAVLLAVAAAGLVQPRAAMAMQGSAYPNLAGTWMEGSNTVTITQSGANVVALCTYGGISWRMEGTVTREGVFTGRLVHTAGVSPSANGYEQNRRYTLSADGNVLDGESVFSRGGGHHATLKRTGGASVAGESRPTAYPDIAGSWLEGSNAVTITQSGANAVAVCTYGNISWRMEGTITREGVFTARLVHTAGVSPSANGYEQNRKYTLSADGKTLDGESVFVRGGGHHATLKRTGGSGTAVPATALPESLTGPWVHSADRNAQPGDNRVVMVQSGSRVTMTQTYKTSGKWVTLVCEGPLQGQNLAMNCQWAPGGNPFGFANAVLELKLSADGNHLDGRLRATTGGAQDSHYSRVP